MADLQWYTVENGQKQGPFPESKIREMIGSGKLKPQDLVWRTGFTQWSPIEKVAEFGGGGATTNKAAPAASKMPSINVSAGSVVQSIRGLSFDRIGKTYGLTLLLSGLVLVIMAKGCHQVGARGVARQQAKLDSAKGEFEDEWDKKILVLEMEKLEDDADEGKIDERIRKEIKEKREEQTKLEADDWHDMEFDAKEAKYDQIEWSYWRELVFVFGSILLSFGLFMVGFTGEGAERWICLIMIAIITASIYIIGAAWWMPAQFGG